MPGWWHGDDDKAQDRPGPLGGTTVVTAALQNAIGAVEVAVAHSVEAGPGGPLDPLRAAIAQLDELTQAADLYNLRLRRPQGYGYSDAGALGATDPQAVVQDVPDAELSAQVAMVRAAKAFVAAPGADTAGAVRDCLNALDAARRGGPASTRTPRQP